MLLGAGRRFDPIDLKACFLSRTGGNPDDKRIMIDIYYRNLFHFMIHSKGLREGPGRERSRIIEYKAFLKGCNTRGRNNRLEGKHKQTWPLWFFRAFSESHSAQQRLLVGVLQDLHIHWEF